MLQQTIPRLRDDRVVFTPMTAFAGDLLERGIARFGTRRPLAMVGRSPAMHELQRRIAKIAVFDEPVLVTGESGVGKEMVARALHLMGRRLAGPFQAVNCPQHQDGNMTVSELFGHEKGSFTGAVSSRAGVFEQAEGGSVFLDEIGDLHMTAQVLLLRALAEQEFCRLGSTTLKPMAVRLVAATNRPLDSLIASEQFRNDLFFRLRYFELHVPPLREREDDWRLMADHQLRELGQRHGIVKRLSPSALRELAAYPWPGNCRELQNVIATGYAMADGELIEPRDFDRLLQGRDKAAPTRPGASIGQRLLAGEADFWRDVHAPFLERDLNRQQVRDAIRQLLDRHGGSYRRALRAAGLPERDYQRAMDFLRHHDLKPGE